MSEDIRAFNQTGLFCQVALSVHEEGSPRAPQVVFELGVPVWVFAMVLQTMSDSLVVK